MCGAVGWLELERPFAYQLRSGEGERWSVQDLDIIIWSFQIGTDNSISGKKQSNCSVRLSDLAAGNGKAATVAPGIRTPCGQPVFATGEACRPPLLISTILAVIKVDIKINLPSAGRSQPLVRSNPLRARLCSATGRRVGLINTFLMQTLFMHYPLLAAGSRRRPARTSDGCLMWAICINL